MLLIRVASPTDGQPEAVYEHESGPFEIGRELGADRTPRCVLQLDPYVSHDHARLEEADSGMIRLTNLSRGQPITLEGDKLVPGESRLLTSPLRMVVGMTRVTVEVSGRSAGHEYSSLLPPAEVGGRPLRLSDLAKSPDPMTLGAWFEAVIAVTRAAAGSDEFFRQSAKALVDLVGLDVGLVLLRKPTGWTVVARAAGPTAAKSGMDREFSLTILGDMTTEKRTLYQTGMGGYVAASLSGVEALIASPVLSPTGSVIGAVYGARWYAKSGSSAFIGPLEAQMVHVLATSIGLGLARADQESEAARLRVQFRQHFSDQLARELELNAGRLDGQDREVTLLFADIRGFSRMSERLGPRDTLRLVSEVMETLTEAVLNHSGVVMDYVGDELIAIWNAPTDMPDHPRMAVDCASAIPRYLARVSETWMPLTKEPVQVGVGINTGTARVGNTGTRYKFKYGALGHNVNLASRIQGATKAFKVPVLVAGSTRAQLPISTPTRRLGWVRVAGIDQAVELHELGSDPTPAWIALRDRYEAALTKFDAGDFAGTLEQLKPLYESPTGTIDPAVRILAGRAAEFLATPPTSQPPILIELSQK